MNLDLTNSSVYHLFTERNKTLDKTFQTEVYSGSTYIGAFAFEAYTGATLIVKTRPTDINPILSFSTDAGSITMLTGGVFKLTKSASQMNLRRGQYCYEMYLNRSGETRGFLRGQFSVVNQLDGHIAADQISTEPIRVQVKAMYVFTGTTGGGSGTITGAINGLSVSGTNIKFGGTLTGDTVLNTANKNLIIATSGNSLTNNARISLSGGATRTTIVQALNNTNTFADMRFTANNTNVLFTFQATSANTNTRKIEGALHLPGIAVTDSTQKGLYYASDYSTGFGPRSLVDKAFVTGLTSSFTGTSSTVLATNGLRKSGSRILLGGPLTGATSITDTGNTASLSFAFGDTGIETTQLAIDGVNGLQVGSYNSDASTSGGLNVTNNQGSLSSAGNFGEFIGGIGTNSGNVSIASSQVPSNDRSVIDVTYNELGLFTIGNGQQSEIDIQPTKVIIDTEGGLKLHATTGTTMTGPFVSLAGNGSFTPTELRFYEGNNPSARYVSLKSNFLSPTSHDYYLPTGFFQGYMFHNGTGQMSWEQFPIDDQIVNGVADRAPSQNAVYRGLTGLTASLSVITGATNGLKLAGGRKKIGLGGSLTGNTSIVYGSNILTISGSSGSFKQNTSNGFGSSITLQSVQNNATEIFNLNSAGLAQWNFYNTSGTKTSDISYNVPGGAGPGILFRNGANTTRYDITHNTTSNYLALYNNTVTSTLLSIGAGNAVTPTATLQVRGRANANGALLRLENSTGGTRMLVVDSGSTTFNGSIRQTVSNGFTTPLNILSVQNNLTEVYSLLSNGAGQFNLYSTGAAKLGDITSLGGNGVAWRFRNNTASIDYRVAFNANDYLALYNNTNTKNTKVSIGIGEGTTPTATLQVRGRANSTGALLRLENSGGTASFTVNDSGLSVFTGLAKYGSDLSGSYDIRTLVDRGYVTGITDTLLAKSVVIRSITGATTLSAADNGKTIEANGTFTITLPNGTPLMALDIVNVGSGTITIAATGTLQSKASGNKLVSQFGAASCYSRSTSVWVAFGDLSP